MAPAAAVGKRIRICKPGGQRGTIFAANPLGEASDNAKILFYGFLLLYSFIGVSIVADMFMAAIERITSKRRRVKVPGSACRYVTTNVWNETVANLTLMALGSSAPEILLAINDIVKNKFHSGELGPATIIGSAAFNLFVIIAVCINAVPSGETRQIKETGVFFITAAFSVFAYAWLVLIVEVSTPDIVTVTESSITLLLFPLLVWISYASDARLFDPLLSKCFGSSQQGANSDNGSDVDPLSPRSNLGDSSPRSPDSPWRRRNGKRNGLNDDDPTEDDALTAKEDIATTAETFLSCCQFLCSCCALLSNWFCSTFCSRCLRIKKRLRKKEDSENDYVENTDEADCDFEDPQTLVLDEEGMPIEIEEGVITFKSDSLEVIGDLEEHQYNITVLRKNGLDGRVSCKYRMEAFSATPGFDYVEEDGIIDFKNGVATAEIEVTILPKARGEMNDAFQIILEDPTGGAVFNPRSDGGEDQCLLMVTILNANPPNGRISRLYGLIDRWVNLDEMRQGSAAWCDQVVEAYYCKGSAEAQEEARFLDWVMHILFFPWQMVYAIATPPPPYLGGWVCFVVALMHIGILTALIGDMAELFGCAADIPDSITAISVVALGTSLPDLFASKTAATQDEWADASIVNVTGSNSVNVFLGIGLPWLMASLRWTLVDGSKDSLWMEKYEKDFIGRCPTGCFVVRSGGDLTFSVVVFTCGALVCLTVIRIRRVVYDGELGGPAGSDSKACSSFMLILLWIFYIALCVWKSFSGVDDWGAQLIAIFACIPIFIALMAFFGVMLVLLRISKDHIGEEGFFGIAVATSILTVRMVYFLMFQ